MMGQRPQSCRGITAYLEPGIESTRLRLNNVERQSSSGDARWSDRVDFPSFDSFERVDFPSSEKVVKMIIKDLDN